LPLKWINRPVSHRADRAEIMHDESSDLEPVPEGGDNIIAIDAGQFDIVALEFYTRDW
jgi:hypothetical protein